MPFSILSGGDDASDGHDEPVITGVESGGHLGDRLPGVKKSVGTQKRAETHVKNAAKKQDREM